MHSRRRTLNPSVKPSSAIKNNHDHEGKSLPHALCIFAATLAVTLSLLVSTTTFAQETSHALPTDNAIHSSTVTLSEIIKTMDFSLPNSYDSIPDPIASGREEESRKGKRLQETRASPSQVLAVEVEERNPQSTAMHSSPSRPKKRPPSWQKGAARK